MKYMKFGRSGLEVSRLCLGCMSFGEPERGNHSWTLKEEDSRPLIRRALELGINFFDTANIYSDGSSEEIVGRALKEFARRDEVVIATKVYGRMREGPNGAGLSRRAIFAEIDNSLRRLGVDHVDLYQIHRWDAETPIEETLEALNDVVRAGKALYIGASSMYAWQFARALHVSMANGWARFVSMQNHLNLLYREEEREMLPLCIDQGVAVMPWSPLARGRLTRAAGKSDSPRRQSDAYQKTLYAATEEADRAVISRVEALAETRGVPMARIAMAWLLGKRGVTSPIIGATKLQHLDDAVASLDIELAPDEIASLEAAYVPHHVAGID